MYSLATPVQREELRRHTQSTRSSHSLDNSGTLRTSGRRRLRRGSDRTGPYDPDLGRARASTTRQEQGETRQLLLDSYLTSLILDSYSVLDRIPDSSTQLPVLDGDLSTETLSLTADPPPCPPPPCAVTPDPSPHVRLGRIQRVKLDSSTDRQTSTEVEEDRARQTTRSASDTTYVTRSKI